MKAISAVTAGTSYYLYAGSCSANNPEPEKNPAYAAATANVSIPGLPEAEAESLRDRLVELAEIRRAGL